MKKILVVDDDATTRHVLRKVLSGAGFSVSAARDGIEGLENLKSRRFDLLLLDVWMPRMNGLQLLSKLRGTKARPRVVVMTSDEAPQTLLEAVREQAFKYVHKPVDALALLQTVREVLAAAEPPAIEVISARPEWVELVVPCTREAAERIQTVMAQLDTDLPDELRHSIGYAFRELLLNAVEWGGRLDPKRKVRIACLRTRRMLMYRIADPGQGFKLEELPHAAIGHSSDDPIAHVQVREEKGIRPGGFGLLMVRESVDELIYNEKRNEVVFVKYLAGGPELPAGTSRTAARPRRRSVKPHRNVTS
jgi:CheY-like chemotaxis protein/anti-sigma regulatory factor (Ser/Thr protein kinase)